MFLVDTVQKRIISDTEIKKQLAGRQPYAKWLRSSRSRSISCPSLRDDRLEPRDAAAPQRAYGYSEEDLRNPVGADGRAGEEPIGSMGTDVPLACLSDRPQPLFSYFKQLLCAGHQSAHRSHPRRDGDVADQLHRHGAQYSGRGAGKLPHRSSCRIPSLPTATWKSCAAYLRETCSQPRCQRCSAQPMAKRA